MWYVHMAGVSGDDGGALRAQEKILFLMLAKG